MTKIFITGYKHSGTTMLMNLLRHHPQVGWIEFEEGYIEYDKPKEWVVMMAKKRVENLKKYAWGDKLPWGDRPTDKHAERAINSATKWLKYFGKEARILHILRHPYDVASSGLRDGSIGKDALKSCIESVPYYIKFLNKDERCATVVYEELLKNPKPKLRNICEFLNLDASEKSINKIIKSTKIKSDRAFAYLKTGIECNINYDEITMKASNVL